MKGAMMLTTGRVMLTTGFVRVVKARRMLTVAGRTLVSLVRVFPYKGNGRGW